MELHLREGEPIWKYGKLKIFFSGRWNSLWPASEPCLATEEDHSDEALSSKECSSPSVSDTRLPNPEILFRKYLTHWFSYLHKRHANGAHSRQRVNCLEPVIDRLWQLRCELLIVENFQITPWINQSEVSTVSNWPIRREYLPGGILQTVAGCHPYRWLQFGDWTKIDDSDWHSANTSPPM